MFRHHEELSSCPSKGRQMNAPLDDADRFVHRDDGLLCVLVGHGRGGIGMGFDANGQAVSNDHTHHFID